MRGLDPLIIARGQPVRIVSHNGTELTSMGILHWSVGQAQRPLPLG
jgi:hypothetical protein